MKNSKASMEWKENNEVIESKKSSKWLILVIVLMSSFMASLDGSIVNVALPVIADKLKVATASVQLVATSYLIAIVGVILIFGKLGDMIGKTTMFKVGLALFTLGSFLCGITSSFEVLILARIIQAVGAAATMANNQGIITETFLPSERGKALGLVGTSVALGSLAGPGLGGLIIGSISWEFIFLINVPIGLVALFLAVRLLPKSQCKKEEKLDKVGSLLFMLSVVPLFCSLNEGIVVGFTKPLILAGFAISIVAFVLFLLFEKKVKNPLLQLEIFENKLFSISIFCGFISFVAIFCNNLILPFYLQKVLGYTPQNSGFVLMVYPLVMMAVAPLSGHISDKIGSEILTFWGLLLASIGLFTMSLLTEQTSLPVLIVYISLMSLGMGIFQSPNNSLVMSTVPKNKLGIAGSINALVRNLGMACGIALSTTLLYTMMSKKTGSRVTDFLAQENNVFLYGMRFVYIVACVICLFGAGITFTRMLSEKQKKTEQIAE